MRGTNGIVAILRILHDGQELRVQKVCLATILALLQDATGKQASRASGGDNPRLASCSGCLRRFVYGLATCV